MATARKLDLDPDGSEYVLAYAWQHAFWGVQWAMNELLKAFGPERELDHELVHDVMAELEDRSARSWAAFGEYLNRRGETDEKPDPGEPRWEIPMPEDFGDLELIDPSEIEED